MDIFIAASALLILGPFLVWVALLVKSRLGSPVLFRQSRLGLKGRPFEMIKFRSMLDTFDQDGTLLSDEQRITPFGQFLRSSSLDELPELWNVLKGDMSIVGPRPLLPEYRPYYSVEELRREEVRPGITGWAQLKGRNALSWDDKFRYDVWYVDNVSMTLDLKIIFATFMSVIRKENINTSEGKIMPRLDVERSSNE